MLYLKITKGISMIILVLIGAAALLVVLGNIRSLMVCALLAGAGYWYYDQLPPVEQERWNDTYADYEKRVGKAWKSFSE